jgi:hypothetical protein
MGWRTSDKLQTTEWNIYICSWSVKIVTNSNYFKRSRSHQRCNGYRACFQYGTTNYIRWWWPLCTKPTHLMFIELAYWNNTWRVNMSLYSETLSSFRATQSLLLLLNAACLSEKQQIPVLVWPEWRSKPTIQRIRGEHANHYTTCTDTV